MILFFSIATILSVGLMIGAEFAVWVFINPILWKLEEQASAEAVRLFAAKLGKVMPFWYAGNFLLLVTEVILLRGRPATELLAAASAIWAAVIILTLLFLVPINNRLAQPGVVLPPGEAHRQHRRWDAMHRARVVALCAAFVLLLLGLRT
jgi:Domain of unknown function (DUF1772)